MNLREKKLGRHINTDLIFSPDHGGAHLSRQLHLAFKNGKMKRIALLVVRLWMTVGFPSYFKVVVIIRILFVQ